MLGHAEVGSIKKSAREAIFGAVSSIELVHTALNSLNTAPRAKCTKPWHVLNEYDARQHFAD